MMKKTLLFAALTAASAPSLATAAPFLELLDPGVVNNNFIECVRLVEADDTSNPAACPTGADVPSFMRLLTQGMTEQSYTLQHLSLQGSALLPGAEGLNLGLQIKTFPFSAVDNLIGKTENTSFIPVFPVLDAAYVGKADAIDWSLGLSAAPPVTVGGASTRLLGASGAVARDVTEGLRLGLEVDTTVGVAIAPVVATPEQYDAGELTNIDEARYIEVCAPQEFGCLDTLTFSHLNARVGAAWKVSDVVQPYVKAGVVRMTNTFDVQVDLSSWRLRATLPTAALGVNLAFHEKIRAAVGVSGAYRPTTLYDDGLPFLYRIEAGISYVL